MTTTDPTRVRWQSRLTRHADVEPSTLVAHPLNFRRHPTMQAAALAGVLDQVGYVQSVVVNERSGRILDGHLRVELALARGEPSVPAAFVDVDEAEERLILATFDPLGALAETNADALSALLADVAPTESDVAALLAVLTPRPRFAEGDDGMLPSDRLGIFEANTIRAISLHYAAEEYGEVVGLLDLLRDELGEDNNAEAILRLLRERYDA
jgi:hypothetical protein